MQNVTSFWGYSCCFKLKVKTLSGYLIYLAVTTPLVFVNFYFQYANDSLSLLISPLVVVFYFGTFHLLTEGRLLKKLIYHVIDVFLINTAGEYIVYTFQTLAGTEVSLQHPGSFDFFRFIMGITLTLVTLPMKYIFIKIWQRVVNRSDEKINFIFMIFPLSQLVSYTLIYTEVKDHVPETDKLVIIIVYCFVIAVSGIIYLILLSDIENKKKLEREYGELLLMRRLEEAHYAAIEEKQTEIAKIRHDIKNQMATVSGLLRSGNIEEAKALLAELENSVDGENEKERSPVSEINAALRENLR